MDHQIKCHYWIFGKEGRDDQTREMLLDHEEGLFLREKSRYDYKTQAFVTFKNGSDLLEQFKMRIHMNAPKEPGDAECMVAVVMATTDKEEAEITGIELADELPPGVRLMLIHKKENAFDALSKDGALKVEKVPNYQDESVIVVTKKPQYKNVIA